MPDSEMEKDERTLLLEHVVSRVKSVLYSAPELRATHEERLFEALRELQAFDQARSAAWSPVPPPEAGNDTARANGQLWNRVQELERENEQQRQAFARARQAAVAALAAPGTE